MKSISIYTMSLALLGVSIGVFVALSRTPVVSIVLPLFFSLIAGASGIYISRQDINQKVGRQRLGFVGLCIFAFVFGTLAGMGTLLWLQRPRITPDLASIPGVNDLGSAERLNLVKLRALAVLLGTTVDERTAILSNAASQRKVNTEPVKKVTDIVQELLPNVTAVLSAAPKNTSRLYVIKLLRTN